MLKDKKILIVQRYFYNFREGFFNHLSCYFKNLYLINSIKSKGRVVIHSNNIKDNKFIHNVFSFNLNENIVIFPFLIFKLFIIKPDIIICEGGQNTINNIQVLFYCIISKTKYIIWDLGRGYKSFENTILRKIYMHIYVLICKRAELIYGYNSGSYKYFKSLGICSSKIIILNNTVDTKIIKQYTLLTNNIIPKDLELIINHNKDRFLIIFVGSLLPSKNIESLKDIMELLGDQYYLLIIGSGNEDYINYLKVHFSSINHAFLGYKKTEELYPYYKYSTFSILPGLGGLAINQSMAFGVPVLCSKADGTEIDLVQNNITGFYYDNINELIEFIKSKTKNDWKLMGINAYNLVHSKHSIENQIDTFIKGINNVLR